MLHCSFSVSLIIRVGTFVLIASHGINRCGPTLYFERPFGNFISISRYSWHCSCCDSCLDKCRRKRELRPRTIWVGRPLKSDQKAKFPPNKIRNQKYSIITFIPVVRNKFLHNMTSALSGLLSISNSNVNLKVFLHLV